MNLIDLFIKRPILTWVMTFALIIFGVLGYNKLGVDKFPDVEFPVIYVTANLEGASPEVMEQDVTDVLEEQLSTIEGIRSIRSTSASGASVIAVEFELGHDIDVGAQDCRDKVAAARRHLPSELDPPSVVKTDFSNNAIIWIPVRSDRSLVETSEYVRRHLKPKFETIAGVASAEMWGRRDRAIRLWVNGDEMRARGLAVTDILDAVHREHVELPSGMVQSVNIEYAVQTDAEFRSVAELERLIVAWDDEAPVRLGDVARIEDGSADLESIGHFNAVPAVALGIRKTSGANTVAVVDEVYRRVDLLRDQLPRGFEFIVNKDHSGTADFSRSIRESVQETIFALEVGGLLAVFTVFVFLRRTRPTMIVGAAIPISLVTTFGFMWIFGYTLNTMTLLAMTLAVGVVIDDAIVVLENIERHREQGLPAPVAASIATREIAFAATAATVSIAVVFAPVVFIDGVIANFLAEFGGTVATSVMVSLFVALTLTPMLAARMPPPKERAHGSIYERLERGFEKMEQGYRSALDWALTHRALTVGVAVASFIGALAFGSQLGREFYPRTDTGALFVKFETPQGTRIETTGEFLERNDSWMMAQEEVAGVFAGVGA
ncbi:MAG: efflux RND transporter permease subunit, partial [Myxococcota bacterium]